MEYVMGSDSVHCWLSLSMQEPKITHAAADGWFRTARKAYTMRRG